jgi:hypothetical protein
MFPHPDTVFAVRTLRNRDLLAEAAQERLAKEATRDAPPRSWIEGDHASVRRALAWIAAFVSTAPRSRRLAHA